MMQIIIPGDPIPKLRPKFSTAKGFMRAYDPQHNEKGMVITLMGKQMHENRYLIAKDPLNVDFQFNFLPPNSGSNASKHLMLWNHTAHAIKPDTSNLVKFYEDCGNGILWRDDAQIIKLSASKIYSQNPCTIITINAIPKITMNKEQENFFKIFNPQDLIAFLSDIVSLGNISNLTLPHLERDTIPKVIAFSDKWSDKLKKVRSKNG